MIILGFFEEVSEAVLNCKDADVTQLFLGWYASYAAASDGRWGIGFVPDSMKEAHKARPVHTEALLESTLFRLAELIVSPFPQEFAAATAACAALLPFPAEGFSMDIIMPCARGDKVAVLGYERDLLPFMRDWGWRIAVFDDRGIGPDCFPQEEFTRGAAEADWVWLSPEALRDRWLISTADTIRLKKGCFLQGPGLPYLRTSLAALGITHIVTPQPSGELLSIKRHIEAGGSPWLCKDLVWRVYAS